MTEAASVRPYVIEPGRSLYVPRPDETRAHLGLGAATGRRGGRSLGWPYVASDAAILAARFVRLIFRARPAGYNGEQAILAGCGPRHSRHFRAHLSRRPPQWMCPLALMARASGRPTHVRIRLHLSYYARTCFFARFSSVDFAFFLPAARFLSRIREMETDTLLPYFAGP